MGIFAESISGRNIKIARWTFGVCAIYGCIVFLSMFVRTPPIMPKAPQQQPEMYYGFATVGLAWQIVFLIIASDPMKYRLLMLTGAIFAKIGFAFVLAILLVRHKAGLHWIPVGSLDFLMGLAFLYCYQITKRSAPNSPG